MDGISSAVSVLTNNEEVTKVITVSLAEWMSIHRRNQALEYERDNLKKQLGHELGRVAALMEEVEGLEKELEDAQTIPNKEIDLINITRE